LSTLGALLFWPVAWALGRALLPSRASLPRSRWEEFSLAYLLGSALICALGVAGVAVGLHFAITHALTLGGAAAASVWLFVRRRRAAEPCCDSLGWSRPAALLLGVLGVGAAAFTLALPLNDFDPILHFGYRGKILHYQGTVLDEALTGLAGQHGYGRIATHPNYPLGLPILEAWAARLGGWSDRWVQAPLAWWALCLPGAVAFALRGIGKETARRAALLVACTPMLYVRDLFALGAQDLREAGLSNRVTLGGGADLPLAAMLAAAVALVLAAQRAADPRARPTAALGAGLALGGAVAMKNEGLALTGVFLLAAALAFLLPRRPRAAPFVACAAAAALCVAPWLYVRAQLPAIDENYGTQFSVARVLDALGGMEEPRETVPAGMAAEAEAEAAGAAGLQRRVQIARAFGEEFVDVLTWGLLWPAVLIALVLAVRRWREPELRWIALLVAGGVALYALILLVTPWFFPSLRDKGIPERLLLHLSGPCAMLVGIAFTPRVRVE
jgi:hypothetical protein